MLLGLATLFGFTVPSVWALAGAAVLAGTSALLVALAGLRRRFELRRLLRELHGPNEGAVVRYTIPLALSELTNIVVFRLPILLLVGYAVPAERAVFNTCILLSASISALRGTFDAVLAPIAAEAWATRDRARLLENLQRQSRLILFAAIPFATLFIAGGPFWLSLYGRGFLSGTRTLTWLAAGNVVNASFGLTAWVHMASGRTRLMLINNFTMLVVELILCLVLIPRFGIEGAAIATTFMLVASQALYAIEGYSFARVHVLSSGFLRLAGIGVGLVTGEALVARLFVPAGGWGAIVVPIAGLPVYLALAWWAGGIGRDRRSAATTTATATTTTGS
jgi:O-antigen/teichoic acid export membrane protein